MSQVTHPTHYNSGRIEVIEVVEDQQLGFHLGNVIKYVCRAGKKDPTKHIEDLEKARWYLNRKIELLKANRDNRPPMRPNDMNQYPTPATPPNVAAESQCVVNVEPTFDDLGGRTRNLRTDKNGRPYV